MLLLLLACNEAPVVTFLSPDADSEFLVGAKVNLEISVVDDQKAGALRVDFSSGGKDLDGSLEPSSSGFLFRSTLNLPAGEVEITATATDSSGASGSAILPLFLSANHDPSAEILAPTEGSTLYVGVTTPVQAMVSDEDETDLSVLALSWTGLPADAPLLPATDGSIDYNWRPEQAGPGAISLTVEDPAGGYVVRRVDFTVVNADLDGDGFADQAVGGDDCNDNDADVHPGAEEHCDGIDEDCDQALDNNPVDGTLWYPDNDLDGYGGAGGAPACSPPAGQVDSGGDCDDGDALVNPSASERCNAVDDNCDGTIPSNELTDADVDGSIACADCNDRSASIYPGAQEVCDAANIDEDCDGQSDDGDASVASSGYSTWYRDADGDGYGVSFPTTSSCDVPVGYAQLYGDCDDVAAVVYPGAPEVCEDGYDNDCSGADPRCRPVGSDSLGDADGSYSGVASNDFAGSAVGGADVDGDGQVELVVGAWGVNSGAGAIYVLSGASGSRSLSSGSAWTGVSASDGAGYALAGVGDTDGDGSQEILVGAYGVDSGGSSAGAAYLLSSGSGSLAGAEAVIVGEVAGDRAGIYVGGGGDVDGDGQADLLIGASNEDAGATDAGAVYLLQGPVSGNVDLSSADAKLKGVDSYGYAAAVADAGDHNGDGLDDILVGAWQAGSSAEGEVYLVAGPVSGNVSLSTADATLRGTSADDYAGQALCGAGDVDNDGYDDILVGAYQNDDAASTAGAAYLLYGPVQSGALSAADAKIQGADADDRLGYAVSASDIDGDGASDLVIGVYYDEPLGTGAGATVLFYGPVSGTQSASGADATWTGETARDNAGKAVYARDLDADGFGDIVVGAPAWSGTGGAYLIWGGGG